MAKDSCEPRLGKSTSTSQNDLKQIMHIGNQLLVKQFVTIIKTIIFTANRITINAYSTRGRLSARIHYNITGKFV